MLQSGFAEQLAKADVLLFIKPERVFITRRSGLLIGLVCRVSVHIHIWLKKGSRLGSDPGLAEREPLSDKGTARCFLAKTKIRGGKFFVKTLKSLRYGLRGRVFPGAILQPCGRQNKPSVRTGAVWSGHRNRGISVGCILQHERSVFLFRSLSRYKPHETENGILNGLKHKTKHTCFTTAKRTINLKNVTPWIH